jgi:CO dehydrogenase/acetyl-CoA synthase delta subunit
MTKKQKLHLFPTGPRPVEGQNKFDEFHYHELMDRAHCIQHMFYELIETHVLSTDPKIKTEMDKVAKALSDFYQFAGTSTK